MVKVEGMGGRRIVIDTFYLNNAITGIRTYTLELCRAFQEYGNPEDELILIPDRLGNEKLSFFQKNITWWKKLIYHPYYFLWKQLILPFKAWSKRADVIICPDYVVPVLGSKALKLAVLHDAFFWEHKTHYNPLWRKYYVTAVAKGLKGNALGVTTSAYSKQKLSGYLKNVKLEVAYQCAKSLNATADHSFLHAQGLVAGEFVLHVGYFDKRKNLPQLIRAFEKLITSTGDNKIKLVLAGSPSLSPTLNDYDHVVRLISELGLEQKVLLPGFISNAVLKALYEKALCYVFPSRDEGFGIPVLEAMVHGLPVLISNAGSLPEIGGDAVLMFDLDKEEDLFNKLLQLYEAPDLRKKLKEKGLIRVGEFSLARFYEQFEEIIDQNLVD